MSRLCRLLLLAAMLMAAPAWAQDWGVVANISSTMGVSGHRICYGEASRGDIGCPADAPTVSGSTITGTFVGDGSGLTGVIAAGSDRIVSGTAKVIANGNSNSISITEAGVTTGYYYGGVWVAGGVSTTGTISGTNGYFGGLVGIGTTAPSATLHAMGDIVSQNSANGRTIRLDSGNGNLAYSGTGAFYINRFYGNDTVLNLAGGSVGVGVLSPSNTLHVNGTIRYDTSGTYPTKIFGNSTASYFQAGTTAATSSVNNFYFTGWNGDPIQMVITSNSRVGMGAYNSNPSTTLHVSGTIRIANGGEACDANRSGAIRYVSGSSFDFCDGGGTWKSLATMAAAGASPTDRIVSGSAVASIAPSGNVTVRGLLDIGTGTSNSVVGIGYQSLVANSGFNNTGVGANSLYNNSTGAQNTAVGRDALRANTVGNYNTGIGWQALYANGIGTYNTAVGANALLYNQNGSFNLAVGTNAARGTAAYDVTGTTAVGYMSGISLTTNANYNTLLGYIAGQSLTSGASNILIGAAADAPAPTSSFYLNIGNAISGSLATGGSMAFIGGIKANGTITATAFVGDGSGLTNLPSSTADRIVSGTSSVIASNNASITFITSGSQKMIIGSNGYIGIGTATPGSTLDLGSGTVSAARYSINGYAGSSYWLPTDISSTLSAYKNLILTTYTPGYHILISPTGNVGIATANPTAKLEVSGTVSATAIQLADSPAITCGPATYGTTKFMNGRPYYCRP